MAHSNFHPAECEGSKVCSISLNMSDRIRLIGVPKEIIDPIFQAISTCWGPIQNERYYCGSHEFKLKGYPWHGEGEDAVRSRRLMTGILVTMAQNGWNILQSADLSKKEDDKDTLFFENEKKDPDVEIFALSFNMEDRIRIIDKPELFVYVKEAVKSGWKKGIQQEREYHGSVELKLAGHPWYADGSETVHSKMLVCQIIANLRSQGYKLYASVDINTGFKGMDLETFFFRKVNSVWP